MAINKFSVAAIAAVCLVATASAMDVAPQYNTPQVMMAQPMPMGGGGNQGPCTPMVIAIAGGSICCVCSALAIGIMSMMNSQNYEEMAQMELQHKEEERIMNEQHAQERQQMEARAAQLEGEQQRQQYEQERQEMERRQAQQQAARQQAQQAQIQQAQIAAQERIRSLELQNVENMEMNMEMREQRSTEVIIEQPAPYQQPVMEVDFRL